MARQRAAELCYLVDHQVDTFLQASSQKLARFLQLDERLGRACDEDYLDLGSKKCQVCSSNLVDAVSYKPCNHHACMACYSRMVERHGSPFRCPTCNTQVNGFRSLSELLNPENMGEMFREEMQEVMDEEDVD